MKYKTDWKWDKDDVGFYVTPLIGFSWGKPYGKSLWFGWFRWLFTVSFSDKPGTSKAFCECGHETLQDPLSKVYEGGTFTNIICSKCGVQTKWDLDAPVPIFLSSLK